MRRVVTAVVAALLVAGCSAAEETPVAEDGPTAPSAPVVTAPAEPAPDEATHATVATATGDPVEIFDEAGAPQAARVLRAEEVVSVPGQIPVTFLVDEAQGDWLRVHLPVRPNGSTGWIRTSDVTLTRTDLRVEVRLSAFRLLVHRGGEVVFEAPIGVGREDVPTPGGVYYIKELLQPPVPGSVYGAYA